MGPILRQTTRATWLPALVLALAAVPAQAARVAEVRVGDHAEFTRIVLELDAPAPYTWSQRPSGAGGELLLEIEAQSESRVVSSRSRLVENVALGPEAAGSLVRVRLRSANVIVKEMVLKAPHRIVLDVAAAPRAAAAPPPTPPKATASPGPPASGTPAVPAVTPAAAPKPDAEPKAMAKPAASATPEAKLAPAGTAPAAAERSAGTAPPAAERSAGTAPPAAERSAGTAPAGAGLAPAETAGTEPSAAGFAAEPPSAAAAAAEPRRKRPDATASRPSAEEQATAPAPSLAERLGSGDPRVGLSFAVGGVLILLLALVALRRRSARLAREAAAAPWPPPGAEERPEFATVRTESPEEAWERRGDAGPLFAAAEAEPVRDDEPSGPEPIVIPEAPLHGEPEVVAKEVDPARIDELEQRLERLEARLADNADARDRLERQLAAHTEELRVQRAAIARTQRAVRAAVRGPEPASGQPGADPSQPQGAGPPPGEG